MPLNNLLAVLVNHLKHFLFFLFTDQDDDSNDAMVSVYLLSSLFHNVASHLTGNGSVVHTAFNTLMEISRVCILLLLNIIDCWTHHLTPALVPLTTFEIVNYYVQPCPMIPCYLQDKSDSENELDDTLGPLGRGRMHSTFCILQTSNLL